LLRGEEEETRSIGERRDGGVSRCEEEGKK
jgi:hypothetical protein